MSQEHKPIPLGNTNKLVTIGITAVATAITASYLTFAFTQPTEETVPTVVVVEDNTPIRKEYKETAVQEPLQFQPTIADKPVDSITSKNNTILDPDEYAKEVADIKDRYNKNLVNNSPKKGGDYNTDPFLTETETLGSQFPSLPGTKKSAPITKVQPITRNSIHDPANASKKNLSIEEAKFEKTGLEVQHTITALFKSEDETAPQKIRLNVPVLYESRELALTDDELVEAQLILKEMRNFQKDMQNTQERGKNLLKAWNALIAKGTPSSILYPDSPSLIENQGGNQLLQNNTPAFGNESVVEESN